MATLVITRGLPGSGKSFRATEWVSADPRTRAQVNRDDLRRMMHNGVHLLPLDGADGTEKAVAQARDTLITTQLGLGKDVVCSDTNLPSRVVRHLIGLAAAAGAEVEVWDLTDVPLKECLARNAMREGSAYVPFERIEEMHERFIEGKGYPLPMPELDAAVKPQPYVVPFGAPKAVLVDVDGTVALMNGRGPYDEGRVSEDLPNLPVVAAVHAMAAAGYKLAFLSGRSEKCRADTENWLLECFGPYLSLPLFMRAAGDSRKDAVVKRELFDEHIRDRYHVVAVFDDRKQVVEMWRSLGLTVFQVAEGNF